MIYRFNPKIARFSFNLQLEKISPALSKGLVIILADQYPYTITFKDIIKEAGIAAAEIFGSISESSFYFC